MDTEYLHVGEVAQGIEQILTTVTETQTSVKLCRNILRDDEYSDSNVCVEAVVQGIRQILNTVTELNMQMILNTVTESDM